MHPNDPAVLIALLVLGALVIGVGGALVLLSSASTRIAEVKDRSFKRTAGIVFVSMVTAAIITLVCHDAFSWGVSVAIGLVAAAVVMTLLNKVFLKTTFRKAVETTLIAYFLVGFTIAILAFGLWAADRWPGRRLL